MSFIEKIEKKHPVENIKYKNLQVWLAIRGFLYSKLEKDVEPHAGISIKQRVSLLLSIFMGFGCYFKKYNYWFFTDSLSRRVYEGKETDIFCDYPAEILKNALIIETPVYELKSQKEIYSKSRISGFTLMLIEKIYALFFSIKKHPSYLEIKELVNKPELNKGIESHIKKMIAQYRVMNFLLKFKKPKAVFVIPSYTKQGYMKAFRENGIKVVEFQHGVIVKSHFGYNLTNPFDKEYFPNYLLTFGEEEKSVFQNNYFLIDEIIPIGSFYLDYMSTYQSKSSFFEKTTHYSKSISVSLQDDPKSEEMLSILIEIVNKHDSILFMVKNRKTPISYYKKKFLMPSNVILVKSENIYEIIKNSDIHITVSSSCVMESPVFGVRSICFDTNGNAKTYYSKMFEGTQNIFFVKEKEELEKMILSLELNNPEMVKQSNSLFASNYKERINHFLSSKILPL